MAISDFFAASLERPIASVRRYAISLAVSVVAAIAAIVYAASALLMALEAAVGPIGARFLVAAILLTIAVASFFAPRLRRSSPPKKEATSEDADLAALSRDQRIAMVFEALMLGFSMGSRKPANETDTGK